MRGFLARGSHALGRLIVSLGYGEGHSPYDDLIPEKVVCLATNVVSFELDPDTVFVNPTLPTELVANSDVTEPLSAVLPTEPLTVILTTEIENC